MHSRYLRTDEGATQPSFKAPARGAASESLWRSPGVAPAPRPFCLCAGAAHASFTPPPPASLLTALLFSWGAPNVGLPGAWSWPPLAHHTLSPAEPPSPADSRTSPMLTTPLPAPVQTWGHRWSCPACILSGTTSAFGTA